MLLILLKITLVWGTFALLFSTALRHETFFRTNRIYLISSVLAGLALPFLPDFLGKGNTVALPAVVLPQIMVGTQKLQELENAASFLNGQQLILAVYLLGFAVSAARFFWGLRQIFLLAKNARPERPGGFRIFRTEKPHLPFSFFHLIFLGKTDENLPENHPDFQKMLEHEKAHALGGHSVDVVFLEILGIVFWFHPLVFWYKNALRNVHEFLADAATVQFSDKKQYGLLLIRQSQSGPAVALANHFFPSQLKKRIVMLTKNASSPARSGWKFSLVLPLLAGLVFVFQNTDLLAQTAAAGHAGDVKKLEKNGWKFQDTIQIKGENPLIVEHDLSPKQGPDGEKVYQVAEIQPEFPGGTDALLKFLGENTKYPAAAKNAKKEGMVVMKFVVNKTGDVVDVQKSELQEGEMDESLVAEAIRVVSMLPDWQPAVQKGQPVNSEMCVPIKFKLN